jgi:hypothetical protein
MKSFLKENEEQQSLSSTGQKLNDRLAKIPGLDKLMQTVTKRDDAAEILAGMAEKLGGDKIAGSKALTAALAIAKKEESETQKAPTAPAAGAPTTQPVKESFKSVNQFVDYLFE